nr:hypothetical protein [Lachnospiraceae bacterium]
MGLAKSDKIMEEYKQIYEKIFKTMYPAKNSTGFPERNLSANYSKAYETVNTNAITWFEFQFGPKNKGGKSMLKKMVVLILLLCCFFYPNARTLASTVDPSQTENVSDSITDDQSKPNYEISLLIDHPYVYAVSENSGTIHGDISCSFKQYDHVDYRYNITLGFCIG